jgi:hypothetical protein
MLLYNTVSYTPYFAWNGGPAVHMAILTPLAILPRELLPPVSP